DEMLLKKEGVGTDEVELMAFLQRSLPADIPQREISAAIEDLSSVNFGDREQATKKLIAAGLIAVDALNKAKTTANAESARRIKVCLEQITRPETLHSRRAAVRVLARIGSEKSLRALVHCLPAASGDDEMAENVWFAIENIARKEKSVASTLLTYSS